jgi:SRSO17 transposase
MAGPLSPGNRLHLAFWPPGQQLLPAPPSHRTGRLSKLLRRNAAHQPTTAAQLVWHLPPKAWKTVTWRLGTRQPLRSRFAALRVRSAHRDYWRSGPWPEQWLLIEWPAGEDAPTKYWLSNLHDQTRLRSLVSLAKQRWIIERDDEELKQELGLVHF